MMTSLYQSVGEVDAIELVYVLCGHHIQNDGVSWVTDLHQILVRFNHSSTETIRMIQKAAAMGTWWLAALSWQHAPSCITSSAEFFGKTLNHSGDLAPYSSDLVPCQLLAFPKTEEISDHWWDSGKYNGTADGNWENCVRSQGAYLEGDWGVLVLWTMFLVSSPINVYFSYHMAGYFLDRPCCMCYS